MPISIACNACGYQFKVKDDFAGRKGKCPKCSDIFQAPGGKAPAATQKPVRKLAPKKAPSAQPRRQVAAPSKGSSAGKKRKIPQGTAVGKPAPKAVKVKSVALPTGQAVASTPSASISSARRRRRRSGPPIWIWLILGGGGIAALVGWVLFATGNLSSPDKQVADKAKQQTVEKKGNEKEAEEKDTEEEKEGSENSKPSGNESESSEKEKASDSDDDEKPKDETGTSSNKTPQPSAPAKPAEPPVLKSPSVTAEQINALAAACREFRWQPKSKDNYAQMAECALRMNQALGETATDAAAKAAEDVFRGLVALKWKANDIRAVNRFAAEKIEEVGTGAFLLVEVKSGKGGKAMTQLIETGELAMIQYDQGQAEPTPTAKWLILGVISPKVTKVSFDPEGKVFQNVRNVEQMFLVKITIATKADPFARNP